MKQNTAFYACVANFTHIYAYSSKWNFKIINLKIWLWIFFLHYKISGDHQYLKYSNQPGTKNHGMIKVYEKLCCQDGRAGKLPPQGH